MIKAEILKLNTVMDTGCNPSNHVPYFAFGALPLPHTAFMFSGKATTFTPAIRQRTQIQGVQCNIPYFTLTSGEVSWELLEKNISPLLYDGGMKYDA